MSVNNDIDISADQIFYNSPRCFVCEYGCMTATHQSLALDDHIHTHRASETPCKRPKIVYMYCNARGPRTRTPLGNNA